MSFGGLHFVTGEYTSHRKFLPDDVYAEALDNFVKGCSDMLLTDSSGRIFLGYRTVFPQPDWWFVGGRMFPGEKPSASCSRLVKRELSLDLAPSRFTAFTFNSLVFGMREQEPRDHGTCDIQVVLTASLTDEEAHKIKYDESEYGGVKWVEYDELMQGEYHPALKACAKSLKAHQVLQSMHACACEGDDAKLASIARELCRLTDSPQCGVSEYKCVSEARGYTCDVDVGKL